MGRRRYLRVRGPRIRTGIGPVGISAGTSSAVVTLCCCGCNLWFMLIGLVASAAILISPRGVGNDAQ